MATLHPAHTICFISSFPQKAPSRICPGPDHFKVRENIFFFERYGAFPTIETGAGMLRRQNVQQLNLPPPSPTSKGRRQQPSQGDDEWSLRDHLYRAEWGERDPYVMQVWIDPRAHALSARPLAGSWATHRRILPICVVISPLCLPFRSDAGWQRNVPASRVR